MFNSQNAQSKQDVQIEESSDEFALAFEDLRKKDPAAAKLVLDRFTVLLRDPQTVTFVQQNPAATPVAALGSAAPGTAPTTPPTPGTADSMRTLEVEDQVRRFVTLNGGDATKETSVPGQLDVAAALATVKDKLEGENATAKAELPDGAIKKSDVKPLITAIKSKADDLESGRFSTEVDGKDELDAAIKAAEDALA